MIALLLLFSLKGVAQNRLENDTLVLLFIGDIMGHGSQIKSALDLKNNRYDYHPVFREVSTLIQRADVAIANLEVTLAGEPYAGYPRFSSPDALAVACKQSGIDVLVTANNHSCDRGKIGILRTIDVLDSLGIQHTGTFKHAEERVSSNYLIINEKGMRIGLLNYTYGTNGLEIPAPTIVNRIDTLQMLRDIQKGDALMLDKRIVLLHWGKEYQSLPSSRQLQVADFLFRHGIDIIIGAHPHVLQPMEYVSKTDSTKEQFIAYSLGNFVSNQRATGRDGGAILELRLLKDNEEVRIADVGYHLTWVYKKRLDETVQFQILPVSTYEENGVMKIDSLSHNTMRLFKEHARGLLRKHNKYVEEIKAVIKDD